MIDIHEILKVLPHRFPFLLIDRILELEPRKKVIALKNVTFNESFFEGHFPGQPVMPGVLICEAMAQASIMLFCEKAKELNHKQYIYYLGSVKVRFRHPVVPGDQLKITVTPRKVIAALAIVEAKAEVGDKLVAQGELSFSARAVS